MTIKRGDEIFDYCIIGAGFGGLGAALTASERGAKVLLCESLRYPGGCASTFTRNGRRFEAGATLSSGFAEGQLFAQWQKNHQLPLQLQPLDPVIRFRSEALSFDIPGERALFVDRLCAAPSAPEAEIRAFMALQGKVAAQLWSLFSQPELLPPLSGRALIAHIRRLPGYLSLIPLVGQSLESLLKRLKLSGYQPLRVYLDALCQITLQCSSVEAEAPLALAAMDYYFRGARHIHGGIGELAEAIAEAARKIGTTINYCDRVISLEPLEDRWRIKRRKGVSEARVIIANLLPKALEKLTASPSRRINSLDQHVQRSWGAVMLYLTADELSIGGAEHWQMVNDANLPFHSGNHVFCSIGGSDEIDRAPHGQRTLTLSSHFPIDSSEEESMHAARVQAAQEKMSETFALRCPSWAQQIRQKMTASPRTFQRFTGRPEGRVGGPPRFAGWGQYFRLSPTEIQPRLYLVGDSVFPGQSTLACALSGHRAVESASRRYF